MGDNIVFAAFCTLPLAGMFALYLYFFRYRLHRGEGRRWLRLLLGNLLVLFLAISLAALIGEIYLRFFYDSTDSFALTKTSRRWYERHYHKNRSGFRDDREFTWKPRPGMRRITFVGDSFTAGQGIRDVNDRFANRIRKMHPDWEVQVHGELGLDSGDELRHLNGLAGKGYGFDVVVLAYCLNDIDDADTRWDERYARIKKYRRRSPGFLFEHSYLLNMIYYRTLVFTIPEMRDYYRSDHDAYLGSSWKAHTPRLKAMRDLVRSRGGQLLVVTFPFFHLLGADYEFRDVHRQLDDFWRSIDVPHLDLLPVYGGRLPRELMVNSHDAHPNELAHSLAADAIARFLEQQVQQSSGHGAANPSLPR